MKEYDEKYVQQLRNDLFFMLLEWKAWMGKLNSVGYNVLAEHRMGMRGVEYSAEAVEKRLLETAEKE